MRMAQLGTDGPTISVLGLGAWAIGGGWEFGWGPQDDAESVAAIEHAVDLGVNWVDTAAAYGWGHSEEVVGRALRDHSDVMVFTKCGILPDPGGQGVSTLRSLNPDSIRKE
ncbi:MAG: aldo/keto reductase, partial [Actinobacteria bacterium ATB1]|nr:aldo/keto reductase [Actinobacteria bacterium ATB1]